MEICTIGFTRKSAEEFFSILRRGGIRRLIDVRLNNTSQLAGFAKQEDLRYFLKELCGADYHHEPLLCPTAEILEDYRARRITWPEYEQRFLALLQERRVEDTVDRALFDQPVVLLCSEPTPEHCHRRLVAEYLSAKWGGVSITHL